MLQCLTLVALLPDTLLHLFQFPGSLHRLFLCGAQTLFGLSQALLTGAVLLLCLFQTFRRLLLHVVELFHLCIGGKARRLRTPALVL